MNWKIIAIVLMVIVVLETTFIIYAAKTGIDLADQELKCAQEICAESDSYSFINGFCNCYTNGNLTYQTNLK